MKVRKAINDDIEQIKRILRDLDLVSENVEDHLQDFLVLTDNKRITGCIGIEIYEKVALLRSLGVVPAFQKQGYGLQLLQRIEVLAENKSVSSLYLLTNTADKFFSKFGYATINREDAPLTISKTREFSELCPTTSIFMKKEL